jgi:hypothetical protein
MMEIICAFPCEEGMEVRSVILMTEMRRSRRDCRNHGSMPAPNRKVIDWRASPAKNGLGAAPMLEFSWWGPRETDFRSAPAYCLPGQALSLSTD